MKKRILSLVFLILTHTIFVTGLYAKSKEIKIVFGTEKSLMRIGIDPLVVTEKGKVVSEELYKALKNNRIKEIKDIAGKYRELSNLEGKKENYKAIAWLCDKIVEKNEQGRPVISDDLSKEFFAFFADNGYANLKEYLQRQYGANNFEPKEDEEKHLERLTYLEDMIMFNDPSREVWENVNGLMEKISLKKGDKVIDVGTGFGFYAIRFSGIVGEAGAVYAVDTNNKYVNYVRGFAEKYRIKNIIPVASKENNIGVKGPVDAVFMCSLYHIIYGWSQEPNREGFVGSLKRALKKGGALYIADNSFANGSELNNCYIDKALIIAQLENYGFKYVESHQITPKRYLMKFLNEQGSLKTILSDYSAGDSSIPTYKLMVKDKRSLIHIGSLDSYDITERGIEGAKLCLNVLNNKDRNDAINTVRYYDNLIPHENFGGEYSALQWFCEYIAADESAKKDMVADPLVKAYYDYLGDDDYALLRDYVEQKYKLVEKKMSSKKGGAEEGDLREIGRTRRAFLEDFILFNNPKRESWEKTSKIMGLLPIKEGDVVVDVGSGSGYFSYRFSNIVKQGGRVYAVDVKDGHLKFLKQFAENNGINNIQTVKAQDDQGFTIPDKADMVFTCSLYHIVYGVFSQSERERFLQSIKEVLREDGMFVVIDNSPVDDHSLPYHGPFITKELIINQLDKYGFKFKGYAQIIPQRYMLTFGLK